jgi:uncharacterized protein (DUF1800 family)
LPRDGSTRPTHAAISHTAFFDSSANFPGGLSGRPDEMRRMRLQAVAFIAMSVLLAACGGGGGSSGGGGTPSGGGGGASPPPAASMSEPDAVRLAKQASFGPTKPLVDQIVGAGLNGWLDQQLAATGSSYSDLTTRVAPRDQCNLLTGAAAAACNRDFMSSIPVAMRFYSNAMQRPDQLRQRVAFVLSQILVASDVEVRSTAGQATLNQIFIDNAFGNYRDILLAVTQNPYMGDYLDMANSSRTAPNENYAREMMELFTMGVNRLNPDGSVLRDASGAAQPNYTATDVKEIARALTGWTFSTLGGAPINNRNQTDFSRPMIVNAAIYDTGAKSFLGTTVPAGAAQSASLTAVVDAVFNHASTAPYISKQLIQHLVTSNPSPGYVSRVTAVFANNGSGVRGDLRAVVRAILTDAEARGDAKTGASDGKVKEPVLLTTAIGRLLGFTSDGYAFTTRDAALGQSPFRAPSVFNFYPPDYPLPQGNGLLSPPSKLITTATVISRHNLVYDWTVNGETRNEYAVQTGIAGATGTQPNWSAWEALTDVNALIDRINLLMLNNTMTASQRAALLSAVNTVTNADPAIQARRRAQTAMYIVGTSPAFQTDR